MSILYSVLRIVDGKPVRILNPNFMAHVPANEEVGYFDENGDIVFYEETPQDRKRKEVKGG